LWQEGRKVETTNGKEFLVDEEDYEKVVPHKWRAYRGYVETKVGGRKDRKTILLHRFLMNAPKGIDVDHINHDPLDNRKSNLRIVPHYLNTHNRKKQGGVSLPKGRNRWKAIIYVNNERIWLGQYKTEQEARGAYEQARARYITPKLLPTARVGGNGAASLKEVESNNPKKRLETEIAMLKTPSASEAEGGWKITDKYWKAKAPKLKMRDQIGRKTGLKLQPNFVEWMMGYPLNWTALNIVPHGKELKD
jgi:hypothetical protein